MWENITTHIKDNGFFSGLHIKLLKINTKTQLIQFKDGQKKSE